MGKEDPLFISNGKKKEEDVQFSRDMDCEELENLIFLRSVAKKKKFSHVKFNFCIFDACYFRQCFFDSCEFIGCKFTSSNFNGSSFVNCKFSYAVFERTFIDLESLSNTFPSEENLRAKLLRSLRVNYQQQGDVDSVNKVILLELKATEEHLLKSWLSSDDYYRRKYKELERVKKFFSWAVFYSLDFIWGNGENVWKLCRTVLLILILISLHQIYNSSGPIDFPEAFSALSNSPSILFGLSKKNDFIEGGLGLTFITFIRLVIFGLFMSILLKKISRR